MFGDLRDIDRVVADRPTREAGLVLVPSGDLKLMIAGLAHGVDQWVMRGDPATRAFSTFGFRDGKLVVVESVNRAGDHAAAKRIIGTTKTLTPEEAADPGFDLRGLAKRRAYARGMSVAVRASCT